MKEKSPYPKIDALRKKFDADKPLTLREMCFVLWAEYLIDSTDYLLFAYWVKQGKLPKGTKLKSKIWKGMFDAFKDTDHKEMSKNIDLLVKVRRDVVKTATL